MHRMLFIGGPKDGSRHHMEELLPYFECLEVPPLQFKMEYGPVTPDVIGIRHTYRLVYILGSQIYLHIEKGKEWRADDIFKLLLDNYYPPLPEKK